MGLKGFKTQNGTFSDDSASFGERIKFSTFSSFGDFFFGLVRIRPLRSVLTISEPWDEGDGFE